MSKSADKSKAEMPLEGLMLECNKDRYKLAYAALRWAKEIKKVENLPEAIPFVVPRAIREILTGKAHIKDIEKLPMISRAAPPPPQPTTPTITLNVSESDEEAPKEKSKEKE